MRLRLLSITHKSPAWIQIGYEEYVKRLPKSWTLELVEIPAEKRGSNPDLKRIVMREGEKMLAALHPKHQVIALDIKGELWSTEQLAENLAQSQQTEPGIDLLIGGPEGLAPPCLKIAKAKWSLSRLTFPHILVKLIVAEQIYRAWSILENHPYHR